jgi:hypothetical protein
MENNNNINNAHDIENSKIIAVQELYAIGFNVLPLEYGTKKSAGDWKVLQTTRLPAYCLESQFRHRNVGVLVGRTSMNLFVVDCDSNESFNFWAEKLGKKGWDKWVVGSNRGGHFWFLSSDGEVKSIQTKTKKNKSPENDYQIWSRNHIMVAPPSVRWVDANPDFDYKWLARDGELPPVLSVDEIEANFPHMKVIQSLAKGGLTQLARRAIVEGSDCDYTSNSEAEYAGVLSLLRIGWSEDKIVDLFERYQPPHYAKNLLDPDWLVKYVIRPAHEKVRNNRGEVMDRVTAWARDQKWQGRTGKTDKLVFEACCERAVKESPHRFRATGREMSKLCNMTRKTMDKSLRRLVANGYLNLISKQKFNRVNSANYYCFSGSVRMYTSIKDTVCTITGVHLSELREHDVWHTCGLGKTALFVYLYLRENQRYRNETVGGITAALQGQLDIKERAVKTVLSRLAENGLAVENDGKWKALPIEVNQLDEIAKKIGVSGKAEKRQELHKKERESYALHVMEITQRPPKEEVSNTDIEIPENGFEINLESPIVEVSDSVTD